MPQGSRRTGVEVVFFGAVLRGAGVFEGELEVDEMLVAFRAFGEGVGLGHNDAFGCRGFKSGALVVLRRQLVGQRIQSRRLATQGTDGFQAVLVQGHLVGARQCRTGDTAAFGGQLKGHAARFQGVGFLWHGGSRRCCCGCRSIAGSWSGRRGGCRRCSGFFRDFLLLFACRLGLHQLLVFLHVVPVHPHEDDAQRHDDPTFAVHEI